MKPADTHRDAHRVQIEGLRRMSEEERFLQVFSLIDMVDQMALARIRKKHGAASERELRLRLASLYLDRATMISAFGWDPKERGH